MNPVNKLLSSNISSVRSEKLLGIEPEKPFEPNPILEAVGRINEKSAGRLPLSRFWSMANMCKLGCETERNSVAVPLILLWTRYTVSSIAALSSRVLGSVPSMSDSWEPEETTRF